MIYWRYKNLFTLFLYWQKISQEYPANYLWELCGIPLQDDLPVLKTEFSVEYRQVGSSSWKKFSYNFDIVDYSVWPNQLKAFIKS